MVLQPAAEFRPNRPPNGAVCVYRAQVEYEMMLPPQPEFREILNSYQIMPTQLSPNVVAYIYSFLKLLQAQKIPWSLTLFRGLFSWMAVPGYRGCLALRSKTRKAMFSGASSSHSDWRDYYFFIGGDLGIPVKPGVCPPEFIGDARWMAREGTLKNLEKLKGQNWPLKDFLRHVKNDISLYTQLLGYAVFKETIPPSGTVLMKRARRGQPPVMQLNKEVTEMVEEQGEIEVPEPICGGTAVDVVSSSEDTTDDRKTLAEVMEEAGKGKEPVTSSKPKVVSKGNKGIVLGENKGEKKAEEKSQKGEEEKEVKGATVSPCLNLVLKEVSKRKRDLKEKRSPKPPLKKGKTVEEEQSVAKEAYDWQQSINPPYHINFTGRFGDDISRIAVGTKGEMRKLLLLSQQSSKRNCAPPGDMGLEVGGDFVTKDLEERMEKTSTPDAYAQVANRLVAVRISHNSIFLLLSVQIVLTLLHLSVASSLASASEQDLKGGGTNAQARRSASSTGRRN
ncbi:hypothetical protein AXF42_Ash004025 [Apostasia shenzhenica]|uniref:Transposase (putative) gypsy type domain-containing protein n=1 Tax=Apostasia shenzhenica TaxID=1088818 RepID=A0A2I0A1R7_9ASPA|nr:hypothetical protein AXF42_Ash004025 [Apostasia shenzhenica]